MFVILIIFFLSFCFISQLKNIQQIAVDKLDDVLLEKTRLEQVQYLSLGYQLAMLDYYRQPDLDQEVKVTELSKELQVAVNQLSDVNTISELRQRSEQQLLSSLQEVTNQLFLTKKALNRQAAEIDKVHLKNLFSAAFASSYLPSKNQKKAQQGNPSTDSIGHLYAIKHYLEYRNPFSIEGSESTGKEASDIEGINESFKKLTIASENKAHNLDFNNAMGLLEQAIFNYTRSLRLLTRLSNQITTGHQQLQEATSAMLLEIEATYLQNQRINKENFDDAKMLTWLLGSLSIILIALYGWYLRNQLITPLKEISQLAEMFSDAQFKELLAVNRKTKKSVTKRNDELGAIGQAFVEQSRYQQKMIFDIDTSCQSLILGFLSQSTSFEYKGEYRLIAHTLNKSKDHVIALAKDVEDNCHSVSRGELSRSTNAALYLGEYAPLQESIEALKSHQSAQLNDIVKVIQSIEPGHADARRFVDPADCYLGANQKIQQQLEYGINYLRDSAQYNFDQNWLKSGLSELNRKMTGEQPLAVLTKNCIDFIADYFQAPIGYIYRRTETQKDKKSVSLIAHYGILMDQESKDERYQLSYSEGGGLIGQVFVEPEIKVKKLTEDERIPIAQSAIAEAILNYVVVIPLIHEERIEGVLELGLYQPLTHIQREFLLHVINNLGIAMNVAVSRDQMNILLAQSQRQAEELAVQQLKLGKSNDMLTLKAKELEEKQEAVEKKNQQLEQASFVMEEKAKELALASRYKSEFLANMSHELRSPLNSLLILSKLLIDNNKQHLDATEVNYAEVIYRSGTDLMQLIEDILDLSKIEAGETDIHYSQISLGEIVKHVNQRFAQTALEKNLDFIYNYEQAPQIVSIDEKRVIQIITNLLSNAFKFTEKGSVNLIVQSYSRGEKITNSLDETINLAYDALCFRIEDTGIGIAQEHRDRVFQAFQQADGTTSRKYGGTGLGLTITQHLVELMGGDIYFHSELSKGSTFSVYLPLKSVNGDELADLEVTQAFQEKEIYLPFNIERQTQSTETHSMTESDRKLILYLTYDVVQADFYDIAEGLGFDIEAAKVDEQEYLATAKKTQLQGIVFDSNISKEQIADCKLQLKADLHTRDIEIHCIEKDNQAQADSSDKNKDRSVILQMADQLDEYRTNSQQEIIICSENIAFVNRFCDYYPATLKSSKALEQIKELDEHSSYLAVLSSALLVIDAADKQSLELIEMLAHCEDEKRPSIVYFSLARIDQEQQNVLSVYASQLSIAGIFKQQDSILQAKKFLESLAQKASDNPHVMMDEYFTQSNILEGKHVLIVDDNISNVFALSAILETYNVKYSIADNGAQALSILENQDDVDLILMDIMMPELNGYQAMEKIRELSKYRDTPILALTAKAMPEDRNKCIKAGANDYMTKPIDAQKLVSMMNMWLATSSKNVQFSEIN